MPPKNMIRIGTLAAMTVMAGCNNDMLPPLAAKGAEARANMDEARQYAPSVEVRAAKKEEWWEYISLDAEIVGLTSPAISAEVSSRVAEVRVMPGQSVKKGQVLVVLDKSDLSLALLEASAQRAQLAVQLAEKKRTLRRSKELVAQGFISHAGLETIQTEVLAMENQLRAATARANLARSNLAKASVTAPYNAIVSACNVAPGAYVRPGDLLVNLWSPDTSFLRIRIPQQHAGLVHPGQHLTVQWQGVDHRTSIKQVRLDIDITSRSFEAQAQVPEGLRNVTGALLSARLDLSIGAVLSVPAQAIMLNESQAFVFTVDKEHKARKKAIEVGRTRDGRTEIITGLTEQDYVIVEGAAFVQDGQPVLVRGSLPCCPVGLAQRNYRP